MSEKISLDSSELDYYDEVIENCKNEIKSGNSVLLDILYNADISDKNYFSEVFEKVYGYPFIEADNMTVMPMDNSRQPSKPYIETATMIGLELIFKRVKSYNNTTCSWYKTCSKALYTQNDKTSIECLCVANSNSVNRLFSARKKKCYDSCNEMILTWLCHIPLSSVSTVCR